MKKILMFCTVGLLFAVAVIAQVSDPLNDALTDVGLSPTVISLIGMAILVVGKLIPQKWTDLLVYVEKLFLALYLGLKKINDATNNLTTKQRVAKKDNDRKLKDLKSRGMLPVLTLLFIFILSSGMQLQAQSPWHGFFGPVNKAVKERQVALKAEGIDVNKPVFMFRPAAALTAVLIEFNSETPVSNSFSAIGFGVSYGKYTTKLDGDTYCNFAINGSLWTSILIGEDVNTKMGVSVTGEVLNRLIGLGPVLYLNSGKPKIGLAVNLSYRF